MGRKPLHLFGSFFAIVPFTSQNVSASLLLASHYLKLSFNSSFAFRTSAIYYLRSSDIAKANHGPSLKSERQGCSAVEFPISAVRVLARCEGVHRLHPIHRNCQARGHPRAVLFVRVCPWVHISRDRRHLLQNPVVLQSPVLRATLLRPASHHPNYVVINVIRFCAMADSRTMFITTLHVSVSSPHYLQKPTPSWSSWVRHNRESLIALCTAHPYRTSFFSV